MILRLIIAEILTPSGQIGPLDAAYRRAVVGIAHAAIWSTPVHEDATALANLVAALNGLAAL